MSKTVEVDQSGRGDALTNDGENTILLTAPYRFGVELTGDCDILFHRWNVESVAAKAGAAKGSKAKKTDDTASYVWRNEKNEICIPGEYLRQSLINAARYMQDPRSPRKSAADLTKAGIISLTPLASLGRTKWDYDHAARVQVQRNGITRVRPAVRTGWKAHFIFIVNLPEYISEEMVRTLLVNAGRLIGIGDFRPSYGRFSATSFKVLD